MEPEKENCRVESQIRDTDSAVPVDIGQGGIGAPPRARGQPRRQIGEGRAAGRDFGVVYRLLRGGAGQEG